MRIDFQLHGCVWMGQLWVWKNNRSLPRLAAQSPFFFQESFQIIKCRYEPYCPPAAWEQYRFDPSEVSKWITPEDSYLHLFFQIMGGRWLTPGSWFGSFSNGWRQGGIVDGRKHPLHLLDEVVPIGHNGSHFLTLKGSIASWNFRIFNKKYIVKGFIWKPALSDRLPDYRRAIILSNCRWTKILRRFGWLTHVNTPKLSGMRYAAHQLGQDLVHQQYIIWVYPCPMNSTPSVNWWDKRLISCSSFSKGPLLHNLHIPPEV